MFPLRTLLALCACLVAVVAAFVTSASASSARQGLVVPASSLDDYNQLVDGLVEEYINEAGGRLKKSRMFTRNTGMKQQMKHMLRFGRRADPCPDWVGCVTEESDQK